MTGGKKNLLRLLGVVLLGAIALIAFWYLPGRRAEVRLPPTFEQPVAERAVVGKGPIYLQNDPAWGSDKIGGSGEPLEWVGCTISCISMALAYHGIELDPGALNRKIKEVDGYTFRGWVIWDSVRQVTDGKVVVEIPQVQTHETIHNALDNRNPVLVKIILPSGVQHWVLVVGRDQNEFLVKDPLGDGQHLDPLSSFGSEILAVRIVRKA